MDETDASQRFYHRDANGALTWTAEGLRTFRRRFARFGIRIEALQTFADYQTAMQISAAVFVADTLEQRGERAKRKPWRELLEAALLGDANALQSAQRRDAQRAITRSAAFRNTGARNRGALNPVHLAGGGY